MIVLHPHTSEKITKSRHIQSERSAGYYTQSILIYLNNFGAFLDFYQPHIHIRLFLSNKQTTKTKTHFIKYFDNTNNLDIMFIPGVTINILLIIISQKANSSA